jgi:hypothetical protein
MVKIMYKLNLLIAILLILIFAHCKTVDKKEADAISQIQNAKLKLKEVAAAHKGEKNETATAQEWKKFKADLDAKIMQNDERIAILKKQMIRKERKIDDLYNRRMDSLQVKSRSLKDRLERYDGVQTDWKKFKTEFERDMEELGKSLKDFTADNKK